MNHPLWAVDLLHLHLFLKFGFLVKWSSLEKNMLMFQHFSTRNISFIFEEVWI